MKISKKLFLCIAIFTLVGMQPAYGFWSRLRPTAQKIESNLEIQKAAKGLIVKTGLQKVGSRTWSFIKQSTLVRFLGYGGTAVGAAETARETVKKNQGAGAAVAATVIVADTHTQQSGISYGQQIKEKSLALRSWYRTNKLVYKEKALNVAVTALAHYPHKYTDLALGKILVHQVPGYVQGSYRTCITPLLANDQCAPAIARVAAQPEVSRNMPFFLHHEFQKRNLAVTGGSEMVNRFFVTPQPHEREAFKSYYDHALNDPVFKAKLIEAAANKADK